MQVSFFVFRYKRFDYSIIIGVSRYLERGVVVININNQENIKKSVIKKTLNINGMTVNVIKGRSSKKALLEQGVLTPDDIDMDCRARAAVNTVKHRARICNRPIAIYDSKTGESFLVNSRGEKLYE